jgi:hypothetical protein
MEIIGIFIAVGLASFSIATVIAIVTRGYKSKAASRFILRPPLLGTTDPRKSGYWHSTNWNTREKVEDNILAGQERYARKRHRRRNH